MKYPIYLTLNHVTTSPVSIVDQFVGQRRASLVCSIRAVGESENSDWMFSLANESVTEN